MWKYKYTTIHMSEVSKIIFFKEMNYSASTVY